MLSVKQALKRLGSALLFDCLSLWRGGHAAAPHAQRAILGRRGLPRRWELPAASAGDSHGPLGAADPLFAELLLHPGEAQLGLAAIPSLGGVAGLAAERVFAGGGDAVALAGPANPFRLTLVPDGRGWSP